MLVAGVVLLMWAGGLWAALAAGAGRTVPAGLRKPVAGLAVVMAVVGAGLSVVDAAARANFGAVAFAVTAAVSVAAVGVGGRPIARVAAGVAAALAIAAAMHGVRYGGVQSGGPLGLRMAAVVCGAVAIGAGMVMPLARLMAATRLLGRIVPAFYLAWGARLVIAAVAAVMMAELPVPAVAVRWGLVGVAVVVLVAARMRGRGVWRAVGRLPVWPAVLVGEAIGVWGMLRVGWAL